MFDYISKNPLFSAIAAGVVLLIVGWVIRYFINMIDSGKIYAFLRNSKKEGKYIFRSTEAISSNTGVEETKVAKLCARDKRFKRNEKEKQSWRLEE